MRTITLSSVLCLLGSTGHEIEFETPFRVMSGASWINVELGHAAPLMLDWDGDGLVDLLVGQFGGGRLRVYPNRGKRGAPQFESFSWFETVDGIGTIPSG